LLPARVDLYHNPDFIPVAFGARRQVITVHDLNFVHYPEFLTPESRRYYRDQIEWAVGAAAAISADSRHTAEDLVDLVGADKQKIRVIYLAASPAFGAHYSHAEVERTIAHLGLPKGFLLFVGTLSPRKNLPMLLRAYHSLVHGEGADGPLVLVGRPGWLYEEVFETIGMLGLGGQVRHLEDVGETALAHLYSAAALLALPSFYEGFGLTALEAMHCGCPVVAADNSSLPEVIGDAGQLVDPRDEVAWSEALLRVLSDSELAEQMRARGLVQASHFSWEKTAAETLALYREV
jgi:glycosyltransferase involved in cell wall biosynthesis